MFDEKQVIQRIVQSRTPVRLQDLIREFRVSSSTRREFRRMLRTLETQGVIANVQGKSYGPPSGRNSAIIGSLEVNRKGFGFVRPDWSKLPGAPPFEGDLFIPPREMGNALHGDIVRAEIVRREASGLIGRVEEVVEHAHQRIVGQYQAASKKWGEVIPRNERIDRRISVAPPAPDMNIKTGDWVEVEVTSFTEPPLPLQGRVVSRLGQDGDKGIDVLLVLRDLGIIEEFPPEVDTQVAALDFDWSTDLKQREDYRKLPTITIDPKTAKDFDDALSIEVLPKGWRLYVHIADVAHFLKPNTPLDIEAQDRATSVYPVDRVVPMLPERLSNYLCSLVPRQDRLTVTAVVELDRNGKIVSSRMHSSVIHSNHRLTYEQAQEFFDGGPEAAPDFADVHDQLLQLRDLSRVLRKMRFARGALDLDIPEVKVVFDEGGAAHGIEFYARFEAHKLVEECMLIANEAVAEFLTKKQAPLLYRVHEVADQSRLERIIPVLAAFGVRLEPSGPEGITPHDLQRALDDAQKLEAGHVLRRVVLRALRRAEYDPDNVGHFGLASKCYCHFTSPIRRYPDVVVHRQVKALERGGPLFYDPEDNDLDTLGEHCSSRERRAQEAEWESTEIKAIEYMQKFIGQEFDGFIVSVHNFGMFVELTPNPVQGFVRIQSMRGDYYELDELGILLKGSRTGRTYRLGDKIRVRIERCNPIAREMDLVLLGQDDVDPENPEGRSFERPGSRAPSTGKPSTKGRGKARATEPPPWKGKSPKGKKKKKR